MQPWEKSPSNNDVNLRREIKAKLKTACMVVAWSAAIYCAFGCNIIKQSLNNRRNNETN